MTAEQTLEAMVAGLADDAVKLGREFKLHLDFSEATLEPVEDLLARFADELPTKRPSSDEVDQMCRVWGAYFGEVVRRKFGGEWAIEPYPGERFATLTLNVRGAKLFPTIKVFRRLTQGAGESVWDFYQAISKKLGAPARVN